MPPRPGSHPPPPVPFAQRHQLRTATPGVEWSPGNAPPLAADGLGPLTEPPPGNFSYRENATHPLRPLIDIAQPRLTLVVEREGGDEAQRSLVHEGDVCRIGTHPSNDLVLEDPAVSRFHCNLLLEEGGWRVVDKGSLNGTFAQGLRIRDADLPSDGLLTLGSSQLRVRVGETSSRTLLPMMPSFGALVGSSRAMRKMFALLEKVAASDVNVFINGESGTGKELVATEIVQRGTRAEKPFVVVDCGAISPTLVESELFGHVRGAFTGADRDRVGAFEAADGGTVFLDEVGELPLAVQPKLLRAIEQREIRRVGETKSRKVNVRILSATNRDLEREVNKGNFREDLYFRLAVVTVRVPPLRERIEDLPQLIRAFLSNLNAQDEERLFPPEVLDELAKHEWPGNVRELRNYVERSVVLKTAKLSIRAPSASSPNLEAARDGIDLRVPFKVAKESLVDHFERGYIKALLETCGGNMSKAARMAGIDRMYLHRIVQKHGLR